MRYIITSVLFFLPKIIFAQGFVTCHEGGKCSFCELMAMVNSIVEWVIIIGTLCTVLILAYAGFLLIVSRGDASALAKGKKIFFQCIIGILIMLASWTIVDTGIKLFAGGELGMWNEVQCGAGQFAVGDASEYGIDLSLYEVEVLEGDGSTITIHTGGHVGVDGDTTTVTSCDESVMASMTLFGHPVRIHQNLVPSLSRVDAAWRSRGGDSYYRVTSVGGYACRKIAGSNKMSNHSYGVAVDINPAQNPHLKSECRTNMHESRFYDLFMAEGWGWGCNWSSSKDAMHFSKAGGEGGDGKY